jgi:hypothetical protein
MGALLAEAGGLSTCEAPKRAGCSQKCLDPSDQMTQKYRGFLRVTTMSVDAGGRLDGAGSGNRTRLASLEG